MAKVEIVPSLYQEIEKKFKGQSIEVFEHLKSLELNPHKGKPIGAIGCIVIKELKYGGFRFYFITDGFTIRCLEKEKLFDLLLRFVRMSDKIHQQETINEIKYVLTMMGAGGFQ